jgi:hypothetical protein
LGFKIGCNDCISACVAGLAVPTPAPGRISRGGVNGRLKNDAKLQGIG